MGFAERTDSFDFSELLGFYPITLLADYRRGADVALQDYTK